MEKDSLEKIALSLKCYITAMNELKGHGVLNNKKDFTGQIGEWLVESIYEGKRATSGIQKGWDVEVNGKHIQVKSHAKAETTSARFSVVEKVSTERIDELIIVVFTFDYKLKAFYKIAWEKALSLIEPSGIAKPRNEIQWSKLKNFEIKKEDLPHQEIVSLF